MKPSVLENFLKIIGMADGYLFFKSFGNFQKVINLMPNRVLGTRILGSRESL
jgi:hypothetical protein